MFIHLHNHSHYSILEGLPKPKDYVNKAVELGMNAVALTDTANIHGCHEFYKEAKKAGITPIMGAEIFVESSLDPNISHKLVLLGKTLKGYQNIIEIISKSSLDNPGKQAKIPFDALELLKQEQGDLEMVCLSGPLSGEIPFYVLSGKSDEEIMKRVEKYQNIFGKENYFIELLYHDDIPKQDFVTDKLIELCKTYDLQPVATNNNYYIEKQDKKTQDVIMALGTGHEIENPDRPTLINGDYSFLSEEEMQTLFGFLPEALENTNKIASMVDIEIETGGILIPTFELPDEHQKIYEEALEFEKDEYFDSQVSKLSSQLMENETSSLVSKNKTSPLTPLLKGEGDMVGVREGYKLTPEYVKELAKDFRKNPTKSEKFLWEILRNRNLEGVKFRRQYPFGRYVADFYSDEAKLVIELDGKIHEQQKEYDEIRDDIIEKYGVQVLRIQNEELLADIDGTIQKIIQYIPSPVRRGLGGGLANEEERLDEGGIANGEEKNSPPIPLLKENLKKADKGDYIKKLTSDEWYLRYLSFSGLNWRYDYGIEKETIFKLVQKLDKPSLDKKLTETAPEELKALSLTYYSDSKKEILSGLEQELQDKIERLEYELVVVHEMGFDAYFLIVADYINWARAQDIPVGPGRGSAAGSLMAFLSGITDIDPLPYDLLFERFLNPARVSMPDIDTDFADTERDKVVEYCRNKYGSDHVAQICTFGTFAARAAVKDVGRVMGIPFAEMNELAKLIPEKPGTKLKKALEEAPEFKEAYETNLKYKDIIDNALKIEGNVRQLGVHACAVIIAPQPMTQFTALQHPPKDAEAIVTQYSAYPLEDLGLLKMDFLGLRNLTVIKRAQKIIKNNKGLDVDVMKMDLNDPKVLDIFCKGDTTGVFQFESDGMRKYLKDLAPDSFEDLIAMVSLYRPGPLAYIPTYVDIKHGRKEIAYLTEELREQLEKKGYSQEEIEDEGKKLIEDLGPILDITYGIAVYQEQLMFLVQYMAGFSLGEADLLRRGVGKKKLDVVEALKKEFIEKGAKFRNYKPETTNYIYTEMIMPAANYSFNKSHAACYAFIAYQTAFLKAYYPTEFLTSLMVSDEENMERVVLEVGECESKGISVLPPSINASLKHFTYIDDENVRFGLKAIKGVGDGPIEKVIEARENLGRDFESLEEFIEQTGREVINKKSLEALILSGSMDELGERRAMFESISNMIQFMKKDEKKNETNQIGLFDSSDDYEEMLELEDVGKFSYEERLKNEKEMLGFFVSGHPLDGLKRYTNRRSRNTKKLKMDFAILEEAHNKKVAEEEALKKQEEEKQAALEKQAEENGTPLKKQPKEKKQRPKEEIVQAVGYIADVRKIVTKTGKNMMFFKCEGFDYEFEVVIFPRDYDTYKDKVELDKIAIVTGGLDINFEYKRKSLRAQDIKVATITQVREQARDLGLFDNSKRFVNLELNESEEEMEQKDNCSILPDTPQEFDEKLEQKIQENKQEPQKQVSTPAEFTVVIPQTAKKEDLLALKQFLLQEERGSIEVFLDLRGQKIPTKVSILQLENLQKWVGNKWN